MSASILLSTSVDSDPLQKRFDDKSNRSGAESNRSDAAESKRFGAESKRSGAELKRSGAVNRVSLFKRLDLTSLCAPQREV